MNYQYLYSWLLCNCLHLWTIESCCDVDEGSYAHPVFLNWSTISSWKGAKHTIRCSIHVHRHFWEVQERHGSFLVAAPPERGRQRKRSRKTNSSSESSEENNNPDAATAPVMPVVPQDKIHNGADEFLRQLFQFMKERNTPIQRVPHLGFKQSRIPALGVTFCRAHLLLYSSWSRIGWYSDL